MKFHAPSFLLGAGLTAAVIAARGRLRPVAAAVVALGVHLGRLARSIVERRREDLEDLWAEVEARVDARAAADARSYHGGNGAAHAEAAHGRS
jgi:hypothetical protein